MQVQGIKLNNFQSNFIKELMGDSYMGDVRAEALLLRICTKYEVSAVELLETINKKFAVKNAEFKRLEEQYEAANP